MTYKSRRGTLDLGYSSLSASRRQSIGEEPDYKRVIGISLLFIDIKWQFGGNGKETFV